MRIVEHGSRCGDDNTANLGAGFAEGVETEAEFATLSTPGSVVQGFLIARPTVASLPVIVSPVAIKVGSLVSNPRLCVVWTQATEMMPGLILMKNRLKA